MCGPSTVLAGPSPVNSELNGSLNVVSKSKDYMEGLQITSEEDEDK